MNEAAQISDAGEHDLELIHKLASSSGLARWRVQDYRQQKDDPGADLRILHPGGPARPLIGFYLSRWTPPEVELLQFAVHQAHRRQGWGSTLLADLLERGGCRQCDRCNLEVRSANHGAIGFYRCRGFEVVGIRKCYYTNPDDDAVLMGRSID